MRKISLIIMMLLTAGAFTKASDLGDEQASRITYEYIWTHGLQTAVTEAFVEFYTANFEGEAHIQKKLIADKKSQTDGSSFPKVTKKELIARAQRAADEGIRDIFAGVYVPFKFALKADLLSFTMSVLLENPRANKAFLEDALNSLLHDLYEHVMPKVRQVNHAPILLGKTGNEFATAKANIIAKLRRFHIRLQLNKAKFIVSLYCDSENSFDQMPHEQFQKEIDNYILNGVKDDIADETDDFIAEEVIPTFLEMESKKVGTLDGKAWHFVNLRVNKLIGNTLNYEQQKALFRKLLKTSMAQPGKNIDNTENGERFKRFINERLPALFNQLEGLQLEFAKLDQRACNPEGFENAEHTLLLFDHLARFNGNINNYLFFLRYFRYYDASASLAPTLAQKQDAIFFTLYKALLNQRIQYENVHYRAHTWVAYIRGNDFFLDFKNGPLKQLIPIVVTLTALTFDHQIPYQTDLFRGLDDQSEYFRVMSDNGPFFVDYKLFKGEGYPQITAEFLKSIVIPQVGQVTDAEHAVLSNPDSLKVVKEKLLSGQKMFKMTDLDPTFTSDQEVYVYLHESSNKPCDHSPQQLVNLF
jgi:hypothetical protein